MPDETDFSAYAAARWGVVVRLSVLLGVPPSHAENLAVEALARLRDRWGSDLDVDLDVALCTTLLDVVRADRTAWWRHPDQEDADLLAVTGLAEVEPRLDRMDRTTRSRLVLEAVARLTPEQVDDVVPDERHAGGYGRGHGEDFRAEHRSGRTLTDLPAESVGFVAGAVVVAPYPANEVQSLTAVRRRRRRARRGAAVVTALVLLAATVPLVVRELQDASGLPQAPITSSAPPSSGPDSGLLPVLPHLVPRQAGVPAAWWARGRLHLVGTTLPLKGVAALATAPDGVVAVLDDGGLVSVGPDGAVLRFGRVQVGDSFATEPDQAFVAWVDRATRPSRPVLVVRDLNARRDLVVLPAAVDAHVVAVDGGLTYVADGQGYSVVRTGASLVERHDGVTLLDVASGTRATAPRPGRIRLQHPGDAPIRAAGAEVVLSDDGRYALVREPPDAGSRSAYAVIDVRMGTSIVLDVPDGGTAVAAAFSIAESAREVIFVIAHRAPTYDLIACDLRVVSCRVADQVVGTTTAPLLAR